VQHQPSATRDGLTVRSSQEPLLHELVASSVVREMSSKAEPAKTDAKKATFRKCGALVVKDITILPRDSVGRGGPVPKLVRKGRWALPVWLLLVAAAEAEYATVDLGFFHNFATRCLGLKGNDSSLRSLVSRVVHTLVEMRLIQVVATTHGRTVVQLLDLFGRGEPYRMPRRDETKLVYVPTGNLFGNGWHLRRDDGRGVDHVELAALLIALTEESYQFKKYGSHQWEKSRQKIAKDYGIAASTWSRGKAGLLTNGLLHWDITIVRGSRRVPSDRYTVDIGPLALMPQDAPQYIGIKSAVSVKSPKTGKKLRLHRQVRVQVKPAEPNAAALTNVVSIKDAAAARRGA
jgi:hypothetical protein